MTTDVHVFLSTIEDLSWYIGNVPVEDTSSQWFIPKLMENWDYVGYWYLTTKNKGVTGVFKDLHHPFQQFSHCLSCLIFFTTKNLNEEMYFKTKADGKAGCHCKALALQISPANRSAGGNIELK